MWSIAKTNRDRRRCEMLENSVTASMGIIIEITYVSYPKVIDLYRRKPEFFSFVDWKTRWRHWTQRITLKELDLNSYIYIFVISKIGETIFVKWRFKFVPSANNKNKWRFSERPPRRTIKIYRNRYPSDVSLFTKTYRKVVYVIYIFTVTVASSLNGKYRFSCSPPLRLTVTYRYT